MNDFTDLVEREGEGNIEFKEKLERDVHLSPDRKSGLASQLKFRLIEGKGQAKYVIGVRDDGVIKGLSDLEFKETLSVLNNIASDVDANILDIDKRELDEKKYGIIKIGLDSESFEHMIVGTAGHVDHGKSTLIGSLVTDKPDDGSGRTRAFFDVQPHEVERGLSADLSYGVYGFEEDGKPIKMRNPLNSQERSDVISKAVKVISFVDTVGHEPWLRTTIRGIVGQKLDFGLLVVAANEGVTKVTKEHLGILLAMELPIIVAITKTDIATTQDIESSLEGTLRLLRKVGKVPYKIECLEDVNTIVENQNGLLIPIVKTSAVNMEGISLLDEIFYRLDPPYKRKNKPFKMYIDRVYNVTGVGAVVSGTVLSGKVSVGENLWLGPTKKGDYKNVRAQSIEMHHHKVEEASAGDIVGISIKGAESVEIERGMVLCGEEDPDAAKEFIADIMLLNHPTKIEVGYEPVVHLETISEVVQFKEIENDFLVAGDTAKARLQFKFKSHNISKGQKFIFREGKSKGVGEVKEIIS